MKKSDASFSEQEKDAICRVAFAFGVTCAEIKWMLSQCLDLQSRKQMFDSMQRQIRILGKGKSKSYLSPYAKFDKIRKKKKK